MTNSDRTTTPAPCYRVMTLGDLSDDDKRVLLAALDEAIAMDEALERRERQGNCDA